MGDDAFRGCATAATRKRKYYELARAAHPDAPGGSCGAFAALNAAYRRGPPPRGPPKSLDNLEGLAREAVLVGFDAFEPTVRHAAGHVPGPLCQLLIDGGHQVLRKFEGLKWVDNKPIGSLLYWIPLPRDGSFERHGHDWLSSFFNGNAATISRVRIEVDFEEYAPLALAEWHCQSVWYVAVRYRGRASPAHGPGWCSNVYHAAGHVSRELCSFVEQVPLSVSGSHVADLWGKVDKLVAAAPVSGEVAALIEQAKAAEPRGAAERQHPVAILVKHMVVRPAEASASALQIYLLRLTEWQKRAGRELLIAALQLIGWNRQPLVPSFHFSDCRQLFIHKQRK